MLVDTMFSKLSLDCAYRERLREFCMKTPVEKVAVTSSSSFAGSVSAFEGERGASFEATLKGRGKY